MNCKICNHPNSNITYKLKNASIYVCEKCKFHYSSYLDPNSSTDAFIENTPVQDSIKIYLKTQLQHNKIRFENHVNIVKQLLIEKQNAKILDVGCGGGLFLSLLNRDKFECYGIEPELNRLKFARQETNLKNIFSFPIESSYWKEHHSNSFDIITIWDVIEHVNDPKSILFSAKQLLKPGGYIIIDTPCRNTFYHHFGALTYKLSFGKLPTFLNIMYSDHPFGHKQILSKSDIRTIFKECNLNLIQLKLFHELSFPVAYYINKFNLYPWIQKILIPITEKILRIVQIKNKMLVIGKLESLES